MRKQTFRCKSYLHPDRYTEPLASLRYEFLIGKLSVPINDHITALRWPEEACLEEGKLGKDYLWLQPLAVCQELRCSFGNCRQSLHQPPASILPDAKHKASAKRH